MRVALVCDWFLPRHGGIELHLRDLALALRGVGVEAEVVTTTPGHADVEDVRVHRVKTPLLAGAGVAFLPHVRSAIQDIVERERFDVVHAHASVVSPAAYAGVRAGGRAGVPTVLTFHSMLHGASLLLGASEELLGWSKDVVLTAVSSVVAAQAARWMRHASVAVLPNAVNHAFWQDTTSEAPTAPIHFVSAMRLSRKKRVLELIDAFSETVRFLAGSPVVRMTIAGDGPQRDAAARLVQERGLGDRVTLPGHLSREALRTLYSTAHAFVMPSERESFGIAALEARSAGLPVIAMLAGGARDFILPGVNGFLAREPGELPRLMARLALDEPLRSFMAHANRVEAPVYDWCIVAAMHRRIYDAAAALGGGGSAARANHTYPGSESATK